MSLKVILSFTVALTLMLSAFLFASFSDIRQDDEFSESINLLKDRGIILGVPGGKFEGRRPVSRNELAVVVARMMKYYESTLPHNAKLNDISPADIKKVSSIGTYKDASIYLRSRGIELPGRFESDGDCQAICDDAAELLTSAFSLLIEQANPPRE